MQHDSEGVVSRSLSWSVGGVPETLFELIGEIQEKMPGVDFTDLQMAFVVNGEPSFTVRKQERRMHIQEVDRSEKKPREGFHTLTFPSGCWPERLSGLVHIVQREFPGEGFLSLKLSVEDGYLRVSKM